MARLLICIHGTNAAHPAGVGHRWWQRESGFANWLDSQLQRTVELPAEEKVFHWSGDNSEHDRREAARDLLRLIRALEAEQQEYHLIGHSHGGSVIWQALQDARRVKTSLTYTRGRRSELHS